MVEVGGVPVIGTAASWTWPEAFALVASLAVFGAILLGLMWVNR